VTRPEKKGGCALSQKKKKGQGGGNLQKPWFCSKGKKSFQKIVPHACARQKAPEEIKQGDRDWRARRTSEHKNPHRASEQKKIVKNKEIPQEMNSWKCRQRPGKGLLVGRGFPF